MAIEFVFCPGPILKLMVRPRLWILSRSPEATNGTQSLKVEALCESTAVDIEKRKLLEAEQTWGVSNGC